MPAVVLVTGGTGLVGKAIEYIIENEPEGSRFGKKPGEKWIFASSRDADLRDPQQTLQLFEKHQPTHVIHLAALVGGLFANRERKVWSDDMRVHIFSLTIFSPQMTFLRDNMLINDNVLHTARIKKTEKVISCLSTCVFPDKVEYPLTEEKVHLGPPHDSNYGYAYAKRMVDVQNRAYKEEFGCNFTSAIPTNVFGPHDNFDLKYAHVIPALIHKCYLAKKNGTPFKVMGDGSPLRQFIYSRDLAKLFIWQLREYESVEPVIFSVDEKDEISIRRVANSIADTLKYPGEAVFENEPKDNGQDRKPASNEKLMKLIGPEFKFTPFDVALKETVEWFLANLSNART
ncbi:epimerase-domain-containing protein [Boletus edulis]|nr:epimerase-domain-containing protein [Boletus edulis]